MRTKLLSVLAILIASMIQAQTIRYVKEGTTGSGTSWSDASGDLQLMINSSTVNDEIWVAAGTYKPERRADNVTGTVTSNDRNNAFVLKANVKIYGGFPNSGAPIFADRNWNTNSTILNGELSGSIKSYHVVIASGAIGTAVLDGFTISGGNANGIGVLAVNGQNIDLNGGGGLTIKAANLSVYNCKLENNNGEYGGALSVGNASPVFYNSFFQNNISIEGGGGVVLSTASPRFINCLIANNTAKKGGGFFNYLVCSPEFLNTTIVKNTITTGTGEAIDNSGNTSGNIKFTNSILFGTRTGAVNYNITYSLVAGVTSGVGNLDGNNALNSANNVFFDFATNDFRLKSNSPVIDKGSDAYYGNIVSTDIIHNTRTMGFTIDLGAFEFQYTVPTNIIYVNKNVIGGLNDGTSWSNAYVELADALKNVKVIANTSYNQIWVAQGTYKPLYDISDTSFGVNGGRHNAFLLQNNVKIYGGFNGTETALSERNYTANLTILSGDLDNTNNVSNGDAYHVVVVAGTLRNEINGFVIKYGNSNQTGLGRWANSKNIEAFKGGGLYVDSANPTLTNCKFENNYALNGGAIGLFWGASPIINKCHFKGNNSATYAGAIYCVDSSPQIVNGLFEGNTAGQSGGAMYIGFTALNNGYNPVPTIVNSTFVKNSSSNIGGAVHNTNMSYFYNCLVLGNTGGSGYNGLSNIASHLVTIKNSLIEGLGANVTNGILDGNAIANSTSNVFTDFTNNDFTLKLNSPAITAGSQSFYDDALFGNFDIVGNSRILGFGIDLGAYEYTGTLSNNDFDNLSKFIIYPNPVKNNLNISLKDNSEIQKVLIYDVAGKQVKYQEGNTTSVDVEDLKSGFYLLEVTINDKSEIRKFIKQ